MEARSSILRSVLAVALILGSGCVPAAPGTPPTPVPPTSAPPTVAPTPVAFELVAKGEPFLAPDDAAPVLAALRPGGAVPAALPDDARGQLTRLLAVQDDSLYLVVYLGRQPSSGYGVRILFVTRGSESGAPRLVVTYVLDKPDPTKGAATVITHPYAIARVREAGVEPAAVAFQMQ